MWFVLSSSSIATLSNSNNVLINTNILQLSDSYSLIYSFPIIFLIPFNQYNNNNNNNNNDNDNNNVCIYI